MGKLEDLLNDNTDNKEITDSNTETKVQETAEKIAENIQPEPPIFSPSENPQQGKLPIENVLPTELATEVWCKGLKILTEVGCKLALKKDVDVKIYAADKNMIMESMEKVLKHYQINFSNPLHELLAASGTMIAFKVIDIATDTPTAEKPKKERKKRKSKTGEMQEPEGNFYNNKGAEADIKELTFED